LIPGGLTHIVTAGEQVVVNEAFRQYLQENNVYLHNHYGPSETHVVTALTMDPAEDIPELPSIGAPLSNTSIFILDQGMNLQPPGISGELCIGGIQTGRGYLNNPELTHDKFQVHNSSRLYRTGDLSRWLADGNIEFLGRIDQQVKIRGFRVEPGEIGSRLLNHPDVRDAVVLARADEKGANSLCAYVVGAAAGDKPDTTELRDYLLRELPDYMVPSYFMVLDEIPLTPNRKVDRRALPSPDAGTGDDYVAPGTAVEIALTEVWAEVLGIEKRVLGIEDNFFQLGGHSLKATVLTARIHKQFDVKIALTDIFQRPTVKSLAQYLQETTETVFTGIEPVEKKEYYPLSSAQKRMYILQRMEPDSTAYNMPMPMPLSGRPDPERFEETFKQLIIRHESLRTSYVEVDGEPVQKVHDQVAFNIGPIGPVGPINTLVKPFDLSCAPLLRVQLLESLLFVDMHHIITDEVSQGIMEREFMALFSGQALPPLRIQYKDYSEWQNLEPQRDNMKRQEAWWLDEFSGDISLPGLPVDFPRPEKMGFEGRTFMFRFDGVIYDKVKSLCLEMNMTLMMFLLSVYKILLSRYTGRDEVVVGTVAAGRPHADLQHIIGFFVNMLALRTSLPAGKSFSQYAVDVKEKALSAFDNLDYPFEELVDRLGIPRHPGRHPLIDTVFVFREDAGLPLEQPEGQEESSDIIRSSHFDLMLHTTDAGNGVRLVFEYSTDLFKKKTIERLAGYYLEILEQVTVNPGVLLEEITISHGLKASKTTVQMEEDDDWL
jgi:acyl carrier protein